jgi:hypothetical protein
VEADVRVVAMAEETTYDERFKPVSMVRVSYMVGDDGPFTALFPKDGFTGDAARAELETRAREFRALRRT